MIKKFFEFKEENFDPIKSFYLHDELNSDVWTNDKIDENIRQELLQIANDYWEGLKLSIPFTDIILLGSLCGYNYSQYSDFDVHIIADFSKISNDTSIIENYFNSAKKLWTLQHNITIKGYDVEMYCQDINAKAVDNGEFSLLNNKWVKYPNKENIVIDEDLIREKAKFIMSFIDDIDEAYKSGSTWIELEPQLKLIWKKISDNRQAGLEKEGENSVENLVFKLLRRNGYINKLLTLRLKIYDSQFK